MGRCGRHGLLQNEPRADDAARRKRDAEEREARKREAEERAKKEARAREQAAKEQAEAKAREAALERERQKKLAEEAARRKRELERPKVLSNKGETSKWPSSVLKPAETEGIQSTWPTSVLNAAGASALMTTVCASCASCASRVATAFHEHKIAEGKDGSATLAVRKPILDALLALKSATSEAAKEGHRQSLRKLFESIGPEASAFQAMLGTKNVLAVTFRQTLSGDPTQSELLGILELKYARAQCSSSVSPQRSPFTPLQSAMAWRTSRRKRRRWCPKL